MHREENPPFFEEGMEKKQKIGRFVLPPRFQRTGAKMEQSSLRHTQGFYMQKAEELLFFGLYQ